MWNGLGYIVPIVSISILYNLLCLDVEWAGYIVPIVSISILYNLLCLDVERAGIYCSHSEPLHPL